MTINSKSQIIKKSVQMVRNGSESMCMSVMQESSLEW